VFLEASKFVTSSTETIELNFIHANLKEWSKLKPRSQCLMTAKNLTNKNMAAGSNASYNLTAGATGGLCYLKAQAERCGGGSG